MKPIVTRNPHLTGRNLPPIEGLPPTQPECVWCQKRLRAVTADVRSQNYHRVLRRVFTGWASTGELWCSMVCVIEFATACYDDGYRRMP